jgi:hypothetical protein
VGQQHAPQPAAVVAAGVELLGDRPAHAVRRSHEPGKHRDVRGDAGAEAGVDQQIPGRVPDQHRGRGEVALVAERPALDGQDGPGVVRARGQVMDGHVRRWVGLRQRLVPGGRWRQ